MERTYDVFVDNGGFVLENRLGKKLEEISEEDIFNSIDMLCEEIFEFTGIGAFSNLKNMVFPNSALTQKGKNEKDLAEKIKNEFKNKGNDTCIKCGKQRANIFNRINKTYVPGIVSLTMYNFANNLQGINICPYCLALTVFSILNCRVAKNVILFNSVDDNFMRDYTKEILRENRRIILIESDEKYEITEVDLIKKMWGMENNAFYKGDIQIVKFNNIGLGMPTFEVSSINSNGVKLLGKLKNVGLEGEFLSGEYNLYSYLTKGILADRYIKNIVRYNVEKKQEEIVCSRDLFDFLNKEVNIVSEETLKIIDKICGGIKELNTVSDSYKKLNSMQGKMNSFEDFLMDLNKSYFDLTNEQLFNDKEFLKLLDRRQYRRIENLFIIKLIGMQGED